MKDENTNTYLADWLAGNLSDDELRGKVSDDDFKAYQKLKHSLDALGLKEPDMEANYAAVKVKKIAALDKKHNPKVFRLYRAVSMAAVIVVLIGLYNTFVFSKNIKTGFKATAGVVLSEGSQIALNAKSKISYPQFFSLNRTVKLDGEAFFEVSKGGKFTVETKSGEVEVLGTKFNVVARGDYFEVACYEGKVKVCSANTEKILHAGDAVRFSGGVETWKENLDKPLWTSGESDFRKAPFDRVIDALENWYGKTIQYPKDLQNVRFTGSFTHYDLDKALQSVCVPMNLKCAHSNGKIIISE